MNAKANYEAGCVCIPYALPSIPVGPTQQELYIRYLPRSRSPQPTTLRSAGNATLIILRVAESGGQ